MQRIYSSKLYLSSNRKSAIIAALNDPLNVELVKQLRSYLDEEYQDDKFLDLGTEEAGDSQPDFSADMSVDKEDDKSSSSDSEEDKLSEKLEEDEEGSIEEEPEAKASSTVAGTPISASESTSKFDISTLLGTLNLVSETSGAVRVVQKGNEVWIHYNDDTNLNNVMEAVIHRMMVCMYPLEFNRLARSDNAIVFEILDNAVTQS